MASEVHCAVQRVSCLSISQSSVIEIGLIIRAVHRRMKECAGVLLPWYRVPLEFFSPVL